MTTPVCIPSVAPGFSPAWRLEGRCYTAQIIVLAAVLLSAMVIASTPAVAGDHEFNDLVHHIEMHYHAHRSNRFVLGFASVVVRVARPEGVKGFKIAMFENQNFAAAGRDDAIAENAVSLGWQPMVRVWSRHGGERTYVYAKDYRPNSPDIKLLVVTMEADKAIVVQVKVDLDRISKMADEPENATRIAKNTSGG